MDEKYKLNIPNMTKLIKPYNPLKGIKTQIKRTIDEVTEMNYKKNKKKEQREQENNTLLSKQIDLLEKALRESKYQNKTLKEQYDLQIQVNRDNEIELKKSKIFNKISITIAIFSLLVSIFIGFLTV